MAPQTSRAPVAPARPNGQPSSAPAQPAPSHAASAALSADPAVRRKQILAGLRAGQITEEQADELLAEQEHARPASSLRCKVSEKGACSVYGLQRMPVTLYVEQWERLLQFAPELAAFLKQNNSQLKRKARD
jgi:hypothetical protein